MTCVVDSSALLAALFDEPGASEAGEALSVGFISAVNMAEAVTVMRRRGIPESNALLALEKLGARAIPFDREQAIAAGLLDSKTSPAGLSLGDRACLALAGQLRCRAITADRAWLRVADAASVSVRLIR